MPKSIQFVTVDRPNQSIDRQTISKIRRHAMKDVGLSRRKPKRNRFVTLAVDLHDKPESIQRPVSNVNVIPFLTLPFELDKKGKELLANVFRNYGSDLQTAHRNDWFAAGVKGAASFNIILANSSLFLDRLQHPGLALRENDTAVFYQQRALAIVRHELAQTPVHVTDDLICAITGLLAYANVAGLMDQWDIQRKGLLSVLHLRQGGLASVESNIPLRITLSWVELIGAYQGDIVPILPLPSAWLDDFAAKQDFIRRNLPSLTSVIKDGTSYKGFPRRTTWPSVFIDVANLSELGNGQTGWDPTAKPLQVPLCTNVALYELLRLRPLEDETILDLNEANMIEVCRLAMLLYIARIWQIHDVSPVLTVSLLKLQQFLLSTQIEWGSSWHLHLWVLMIAAIQSHGLTMRNQFVLAISNVAIKQSLVRTGDILGVVKQVSWLDLFFDQPAKEVLSEVERLLPS